MKPILANFGAFSQLVVDQLSAQPNLMYTLHELEVEQQLGGLTLTGEVTTKEDDDDSCKFVSIAETARQANKFELAEAIEDAIFNVVIFNDLVIFEMKKKAFEALMKMFKQLELDDRRVNFLSRDLKNSTVKWFLLEKNEHPEEIILKNNSNLYRIVESQNRQLLERIIGNLNGRDLLEICQQSPSVLVFLFNWQWSDDVIFDDNSFYQDLRHSHRIVAKILLKLRTFQPELNLGEIGAVVRQNCLIDAIFQARDAKKCSDRDFFDFRNLLSPWFDPPETTETSALLSIAVKMLEIGSVKVLVDKNPSAVALTIPNKTGDFRTPLEAAACQSNLEIVRMLADAFPKAVEVMDECCGTPLSYAAERGTLEIVDFLFEKYPEAALIKDSYYNRTPLAFAAAKGHFEVVRFLAEKYPETVEIPDRNGRTALSLAAEIGNLATVQFLFEKFPIAIEMPDKYDDQLPLIFAAKGGHCAATKFLYEKYPKAIEIPDGQGETVLSYAARRGDLAMVEFLYEQYPPAALMKSQVSWCVHNGTTAGLNALTGRHFKVAEFLFEKSPKSAEIGDNYGTLPLSIAIREAAPLETVQLLYEANPKAAKVRDEAYGQTPLSYASWYGDLEIVRFLWEKFPKAVQIPDKYGQTSFSHGCERGDLEIVTFLYDKFPKAISIPDKKGRLPLSFAAISGSLDVVKFVFEKFPKAVEVQDEAYGLTALSYAATNVSPLGLPNNKNVFCNTITNGNAGTKSQHCNLETVKFLFEQFPAAAILPCKDGGETPALKALKGGQLEVAKFLFESFPQTVEMIADEEGDNWTPLFEAASRGYLEMVKLLYEAYPDAVEMVDNEGRTALSLAASAGHYEVVKFLFEKYPQAVDIKDDENGRTPLDWAKLNGNLNVVKFLISAKNN